MSQKIVYTKRTDLIELRCASKHKDTITNNLIVDNDFLGLASDDEDSSKTGHVSRLTKSALKRHDSHLDLNNTEEELHDRVRNVVYSTLLLIASSIHNCRKTFLY